MNAIWVKWVDSAKCEGWNSRADISGMRVISIEQVGFLIQEDDEQVLLSQTINSNSHDATTPYLSPIVIPKVAILERRDVEVSQ